jgi:hypothetical protein
MAGAASFFTDLEAPGRYKRKAAETLVRVRLNRLAHRPSEGIGRAAAIRLLAQAAAYRSKVTDLQTSRIQNSKSASSVPGTVWRKRLRPNTDHDPVKGTLP